MVKLSEVFDEFDRDMERQGKSRLTRRGYRADLQDLAGWVETTYGEELVASKLTRDDVRAYLSHLTTVRKARPSTVNRRLAALSTFCRWATSAGILKNDPTADVKGVRQVKTPPRALERADLNRLLRKAQQSGRPLHAAVVTLIAHTGLRVGEVCGLELDDVEIRPRSGKVIVRSGKGGKYREVPLNAEARQALGQYIAVRPHPAREEMDRLFIGQRGEPLTPGGVWRIVVKYARQAGIEEVSPHVLRHTFATLLLREHDTDLVTVADLLGHENVNTTARYTRSTEADRQAAVEALGVG